MEIADQLFYDLYLNDGDELGKELVELVFLEQKRNKNYQVIVQQVIQINENQYSIILNLLE